MAKKQTKDRIGAIVLTALLFVSCFAAVPLAAADHTDDAITADQRINATESVDVWNRAPLPLRADTDDAAYTIPNANWSVVYKDLGQKDLVDKREIGVYSTDKPITLSFDLSKVDGIKSDFKGKNVHLIAARASPDLPEDVNASDLSKENASERTPEDPMSLLTTENANRNASFYHIDVKKLNDNGDVSFEWTPPQAGQYTYFLAFNEDKESGLDVNSETHNVTVTGHSTIIGIEQTFVQSEFSDVNPLFVGSESNDLVVPGENLNFKADASGIEGENVTHTILVYDEETGFAFQEFTIKVTGDVTNTSDLDEHVEIVSSVKRLNGVARVSNDTTSASRAGSPSLDGFLEELNAEAGWDVPQTSYKRAENSDFILDGSMTTYFGDKTETITVETRDEWARKTPYRWIHIAVSDEGDVQTDSGTFTLPINNSEPNDGDDGNDGNDGNNGNNEGGAPPSGGGGGGGGNIPSTLTDVTSKNGKATIAVTNVRKGSTVNVRFIAGQVGNGVFEMDGIAINPGSDLANFDMSVTPLDAVPSGVPAVEDEMPAQALTYFQIDHTISNDDVNGVTYSFDVKKSSLNGQAPENVVLYRYHEGSWSSVTTRFVGQSGSTYEYEADSPGLSVYAIGVAQPDINVENAELKTSTIQVGDDAEVTVTVSNTGDGAGTETLELTADGNTLSETEITLESGETRTITLSETFDDAGTYEIAVEGNSAGTLTVEGSGTTTKGGPGETTDGDDDSDGGLGAAAWFLILVILVALGGGVLYIRRQQL